MACVSPLYKLFTYLYDQMEGTLLWTAFLRADFDFFKSGQEVQFDLEGNVAWRNWQATLAQQYIEWGMYALQERFPQLYDSFRSKRQGRGNPCCWQSVVLYNFRANKAGLNQILNMYMPALSNDANFYIQQSINGLVHTSMLLYLLYLL